MGKLAWIAYSTIALFAYGCASSNVPGQCNTDHCDGGAGGGADLSGSDVDMDVSIPAVDMTEVDLAKKKFGDPCTNPDECASGFCIFTGTDGVCSRTCANDCPPGYGCYGVLTP